MSGSSLSATGSSAWPSVTTGPDDPRIGITSTVPSEVLYAAGRIPVDLNNVFVGSEDPLAWVEWAESQGFPRNCCAWIKGIYTAAHRSGLRRVIIVSEGDCSQTHALGEVLRDDGIETIPFAFPQSRQPEPLAREISALAAYCGATPDAVRAAKNRLDAVRSMALEIDRVAWAEGRIGGAEAHWALVSCSDMCGNPEQFAERLLGILRHTEDPAGDAGPRIGLLGVPPMIDGLHDCVEEAGARVVFAEVPRQFAMPLPARDLVDQYLQYTYPYGVSPRLDDIGTQIAVRRIDGLIHYVQSFCFRQIADLLLRRHLPVPILTLEGDRPGPVDGATRIRIETFVDMLGVRRPPKEGRWR